MALNSPRAIQILPEHVVHKIAAGEVVERPVSVVKELIENALDAGATRIHVSLEQGGCRSIVVADDGCGIPPQEILLALKRHATSKIRSADDLFNLHTLGFRGEALPSIAGISDFRLESATEATAPVGYAVAVKESRAGELQELPMNRGTRIVVQNLFNTVPARLKFLKRPETEWGHVLDLLTAMALHHLAVEWRLEHNGKTSLFCPRADDARRRILDLFGRETAEKLYPISREVSGIRLEGLIGHPNFSQKSSRNLYVFVNGRYVQDRLIIHAIANGYRGLLMTQQYPMAVLQLRVDPAQVDVNVHPTKREVRFSNSSAIHHLLSESIRHELEKAPWQTKADAASTGSRLGDSEVEFRPTRQESWPAPEAYRSRVQGALADFAQCEEISLLEMAPRHSAKIGTLAFSELRLIGQFHATYLVCESQGSLLLLDQHAAHERIGFEKLKRSHFAGGLAQQRLLQPLTFALPEREAVRLNSCLPKLEEFGFSVEEFGENSFVLKAHPTLLKGVDWVELLREVSQELEESVRLGSLEDRIDHVLATMACHRQIRANHRLSEEEMLALIRDLEGTPRGYHCPHGRPVLVEIEGREIEKWFKRVL